MDKEEFVIVRDLLQKAFINLANTKRADNNTLIISDRYEKFVKVYTTLFTNLWSYTIKDAIMTITDVQATLIDSEKAIIDGIENGADVEDLHQIHLGMIFAITEWYFTYFLRHIGSLHEPHRDALLQFLRDMDAIILKIHKESLWGKES